MRHPVSGKESAKGVHRVVGGVLSAQIVYAYGQEASKVSV
jgi:hypothetical protein